ncbi:MAG: diacylglycerol/lipid kinase family protein [Lachnospiraceae bacterium]
MRGLFIINPSSGKQNIKETIRSICGRLVVNEIANTIDVFFTKQQDDAKNRAAQLKEGEYDFVVSVGGDGTLNEVINGLVISGSKIPLAIISAGTVNDFASSMGLPQTPKAFCDMIKNFKYQEVDVGKVNNEYFINVIAGGLLTDVAYKVPKDKKAVMGKFAYYIEGAKDLPNQIFNTLTLKFESEEYTQEENIMLFLVMNSNSVGGYKDAAPLASVSDGVLDVVVLRKLEFLEVSTFLLNFMQGEYVNHPAVQYFQTKNLKVSLVGDTQDVAIDYDGELLKEGLPIEISILPKEIKILVP